MAGAAKGIWYETQADSLQEGDIEMGGGSSSQTTRQTVQALPPYYAMGPAVEETQHAQALGNWPYSQYPYVPTRALLDPSDPRVQEQGFINIFTGETRPLMDYLNLPVQSTIAPLNAQQYYSLGQIQNFANQPSSILGTASKQLTDTMGGSYLNPQSNPFLAQYAQQAMGDVTRNYENSIVPQLSAAATRAGAFGGSGDTLMRTEAMRNLGDTLSKVATGIYEPAYEAERNRQLQAQFYAPTLDTAYLPHYQAGLAAGDIERQAQQDYLNEMYTRWQQALMWPYQAASAGAGIASPYMSPYSTTTGTSTQTTSGVGASPFSQIMGGAISGLGLLGGIFSDIRTKENMKPLEIMAAMNPIAFDYKPEFGDTGQIGFIADEIEKVAPGMVTTGPDGFKRIQVMSVLTLLIKAVQDQQKQINALLGVNHA